MNPIANQFASNAQGTDQFLSNKTGKNSENTSDVLFEDVLRQKKMETVLENSSLKFSKHASLRLLDRNIDLTESQNARLENGVKMAQEKGIQESLVLVDSLAFIVNVPNQTVVTAMDQTETNSNVFTNIDGAVIM